MPKTVVRRVHKAVTIGQFLAWLDTQTIRGCRAAHTETNDADFMIVPRAVNALVDRISAELRLAHKAPDQRVRIPLPEAVSQWLAPPKTSSANRLALGDEPDRVRVEAGQAMGVLKQTRAQGAIVDGADPKTLEHILAAGNRAQIIVALPQVFFERDIAAIKKLVSFCARANLSVEVNSWGGWWLARQTRVRIESGPGLPVLNALAARRLREAGAECVTLAMEADRKQWEDVTACCPVACSLVVFGPSLASDHARATGPRAFFSARFLKTVRGVRLVGPLGAWPLDVPSGRSFRSSFERERTHPRATSGGRSDRFARSTGRLVQRAVRYQERLPFQLRSLAEVTRRS